MRQDLSLDRLNTEPSKPISKAVHAHEHTCIYTHTHANRQEFGISCSKCPDGTGPNF